ncbi:MAG: CoF synthetase, partial [Gemmatimonadetes bacterium]|nr:CoF synthetase [Gemmatimonadota bacterium]
RSRELSRPDLYGGLSVAFGVDQSLIVNEYGMTELLSQFYESHLAEAWRVGETVPKEVPPVEGRFHRGPPWVRTQILDSMTLEPKGAGEVGVLAHMDLANLGSVAPVLTEDLGCLVPEGFQLVGRSPGSEPRGCSLAMEDFLASHGGRP